MICPVCKRELKNPSEPHRCDGDRFECDLEGGCPIRRELEMKIEDLLRENAELRTKLKE